MDRYKKLLEFIQGLADEQADARWRDRIEALEERLAAMGASERQWEDRMARAVQDARRIKWVEQKTDKPGITRSLMITKVWDCPDGICIQVE